MTDSILETNLKALEAIYPGQARLIQTVPPSPLIAHRSSEELETFAQQELERRWDPQTESHVVIHFAGSPLARGLFDRLQLENLRTEKNRRLILLEDCLENIRFRFESEDWRLLIESELCLFVLSPQIEKNLQRLLQRYPDIAGSQPILYSGDPDDSHESRTRIEAIFLPFHRIIAHRFQTLLAMHGKDNPKNRLRSPYPRSVRFFVPGHNYLQDACTRAFQQMGYDAQRLQWKTPLYRFVRSTAWGIELEQNPFDLAFFLNATSQSFGCPQEIERLSMHKVSWFVDNPRRYGYERHDFEGCQVIGVFDRTYIPDLQQRSTARIIELRTGFGIDPSLAIPCEEFASIDIAFVGELGTPGFLPLEKGFQRLDPALVEAANGLLKDLDITQPIQIIPFADEIFARYGWPYQGALVEFLENKASALRRRYYLDVLADQGIVIFGGEEWRNDPSGGPLRACYGGRRIDYSRELPSLYASAKININIFHVQCATAPNPRVYDVLASGGFLLTSDAPGLEDEFEPGKDFVVFRSRMELLDQVRYYLSHPEERTQIADHGRKRALASCGYHDRMQFLLSAFDQPAGETYVDFYR